MIKVERKAMKYLEQDEPVRLSADKFIKKMRDFNRDNITVMSIRNEEEKENEVFINKHIQSSN